MSILLDIITFILVLAVIVIVHEGGHFFFARRANILCREFAFGMGPLLISKKKGETLYSLRAFPIGGFCAIAGEEAEDDPLAKLETIKLRIEDGIIKGIYLDVDDDKVSYPLYKIISYDLFDALDSGSLFMEVELDGVVTKYPVQRDACLYTKKLEWQIGPHDRLLNSKKKWQRGLVIFGGPLFNFILAFVVFLLVGLIGGFSVADTNVLGNMEEVSPTYVAGLRDNDAITALSTSGISKNDIVVWNDISLFMSEYKNSSEFEKINIKYLRDGTENTVSVFPSVVINNLGITNTDELGNTSEEVVIKTISKSKSKTFNNFELNVGDKITYINNEKVDNWKDVYDFFEQYTGDNSDEEKNNVSMKVLRDGEEIDVTVKPYSKSIMESQVSMSGSTISQVIVYLNISPITRFSLGQSIKFAGVATASSFTLVARTLKLLFSGSVGVSDMSGPVGIFSLTSRVRAGGILSVLQLIGMLSVNIGLMNLLPIPALDGGRLVFLAYEAVTKKRPNEKLESILIMVTFVLLLGLIIFVTYGDILRLIGIR